MYAVARNHILLENVRTVIKLAYFNYFSKLFIFSALCDKRDDILKYNTKIKYRCDWSQPPLGSFSN